MAETPNEVTPVVSTDPQPSGDLNNLAADVAILNAQYQAEQQKAEVPQTEVIPETPVTEAPKEAPAQEVKAEAPIPDKFKNPDGTVNTDRIEKATIDADVAYAKFREKEIALKRKINEVQKMQTTQVVPSTPETPQVPPAQPGTFDAQIEADIKQYGVGKVLAKLFEAAKDAAKNESLSEIESIRMEAELNKRQRELENIAKYDPNVLSDDMFNTLSKIREEKPYLNQSPTPWTAAYREYLADKAMQERMQKQVPPNPKGPTAPVAPVGPVPHPKPSVDITKASGKDINAAFSSAKDKAELDALANKFGIHLTGGN